MDTTTQEDVAGQSVPTTAPSVQNAPVADVQGGTTQAPVDNSFKIPDEYKDAGWVKNIKSTDDLFKAHANAQSLIGKKTIGLPDWNDEKQVNEFLGKLRPEKADAYQFPEGITDTEKKQYGEMFHKAGLSEYQAKQVLDNFYGIVSEQQKQLTSPEVLKSSLAQAFNNDDKKIAELSKDVSSIVGKDFFDDKEITNKNIVAMFKFADALKQQYGVKELNANANSNASSVGKETAGELQKLKEAEFVKYKSLEGQPYKEKERANSLAKLNEYQDKLFKLQGRM